MALRNGSKGRGRMAVIYSVFRPMRLHGKKTESCALLAAVVLLLLEMCSMPYRTSASAYILSVGRTTGGASRDSFRESNTATWHSRRRLGVQQGWSFAARRPVGTLRSNERVQQPPYERAGLQSVSDDASSWEHDGVDWERHGVILEGLNPSQIEATTQPLQSITRVVAGPGAGKTRVLTCRIAYLLKEDDDEGGGGRRQSRVLAVTFTKKAALEMKERLERLLIHDQRHCTPHAREDDVLHHDDAIVEEYRRGDEAGHNQRILPPPSITRVTLGTFHSICSKILRWHGKEISNLPSVLHLHNSQSTRESHQQSDAEMLPPTLDGSFAIIDQSEQMRIIRTAIKDLSIDLKSGGRTEIRPITILNAVSHLKSQLAMELAIDGKPSAEPRKPKEAVKMTQRVRKIAEEVFPYYTRSLLQQNAMDFDDLILKTRELLVINNTVRDNMRRRWRHILVDEFQDTSEAQLDLIKLLTSKSLLVVGDGDQSIYSWRGAYAESMSNFVHEFDRPILQSDGHDATDQVIASDQDQEKEMRKEKKQVEVNTVYLMENYRSTTNIVKAAQKIISGDKSSTDSQASIRQEMKPMRGKGPSPRVLSTANSKSEASFVVSEILKMEAAGSLTPLSSVAIIYRTNAQSRSLEEACVAKNLRYLVRGNAGTFYSRVEIKDCLCFLRLFYNGSDRQAMARAVKTPTRGIGEVSLNEFFDYCDEVSRSVLLDETEEAAGDNVGSNKQVRVTPMDVLLSLSDTQDDESDYHHTEDDGPRLRSVPPEKFLSKRTMNKLRPFASQMKTLQRKARTETVSELLSSIIDTMQLRNHFDSISKTSDEFVDRWSNVMELKNAAERYAEDGASLGKKKNKQDDKGQEDSQDLDEVSPLGNFLDDISLLTEQGNSDADDTNNEDGHKRLCANLMTIHASKGMEFDAVFLVGNEEGTFPTQRAIAEGEGSMELEEERRLCYVAMTRAKTHLVMTSRREVVTFFGQGMKVNQAERSRFLDALISKKKRTNSGSRQVSKTSTPDNAVRNRAPSRSAVNANDLGRLNRWNPGRSSSSADRISRKDYISATDASRGRLTRNSSELFPGKIRKGIVQNGTPERNVNRQRQGVRKKIRTKDSRQNNAREDRDAPPQFDSTLFHPIGSSVLHAVHGSGRVIAPPPSSDESLIVCVRFEDGLELPFPLGDPSLRFKLKG